VAELVTAARDLHRTSVYQAEDQWSAILDRGGRVDFFGSTVDAPVQLRFGSLEDAQIYTAHVVADLGLPEVQVRHRKGGTRAHYSDGVIAIPSYETWAMRETVLLHEIAHHVCITRHTSAMHDARFTSSLLSLVEYRLGPEAALLLRTGYQASGVPIAVSA